MVFIGHGLIYILLLMACGGNAADHYKILGVPRNASLREIEKAFRRKAKDLHPDSNPGKETEFAEVANAYEILKDPEKKKKYDMYGDEAFQEQAGGPQYHQGGAQHYEFHTVDDSVFDSIFSGFQFGGGGFKNTSFQFNRGNRMHKPPSFENSPIIEIGASEYDASIKSLRVLNLYFYYMETCGHCREATPLVVEFAKRFKDVVQVHAINCNRHSQFCAVQQVSSVPYIYAISVDDKHRKLPFGNRDLGQLDAWLHGVLPSRLKLLTEVSDYKAFVKPLEGGDAGGGAAAKLRLLAIVKRGVQLSRLKALSVHFQDKAKIAYIKASNVALVKLVGSSRASTEDAILFQVDPDGTIGEALPFGQLDYSDAIFKLNIMQYQVANDKYFRLTKKRQAQGECSGLDNQYCFIFVKYGHKNEAALDVTLRDLARRFSNDPVKIRFVVAQESGKFISAFGLPKTCPFYQTCSTFLVYRAKRRVYKVMDGNLTNESLEKFINDVVSGSIRLTSKVAEQPITDEF